MRGAGTRQLRIGGIIGALLVLTTIVSFIWLPHNPTAVHRGHRLAAPSVNHPMGTDQLARDVASRVMVGARTTVLVGIVSVGIGLIVGVLAGGTAGFFGGWWDELMMRLMDALIAFPTLLLALIIVTALGPGTVSGIVAIGLASVPTFARLTRGNFLVLREQEFVTAAQALGASNGHILLRHLLPNTAAVLLVQASLSFATAILADASLSYLGLGTQPPHPSWGRMLREAQPFLPLSPYPALFPGLAIALTVLGLNLLGDGLRDRLDPRSSHRR